MSTLTEAQKQEIEMVVNRVFQEQCKVVLHKYLKEPQTGLGIAIANLYDEVLGLKLEVTKLIGN